MSAYNSMNKRIKNALVALASSVQYDTGDGPEPAFAQVLDNMRNVFNGWPNVQVLPKNLGVNRETAGQADKAPAFFLRIRVPMEDTDQSQSAAYDQMYDLTDLLVDAFIQMDHDQSLTDDDGTIAITMMDTSSGDWTVVESGGGAQLVCDVDVAITYSKTLY